MNGIKNITITRLSAGMSIRQNDAVVEESPLQILLSYGVQGDRKTTSLSVTMRTPGDDHNLVAGFLFCEGIINDPDDVLTIRSVSDAADVADAGTILAELAPHVLFDPGKQQRNFVTSSACGFCGKTSAVMTRYEIKRSNPRKFSVPLSLLQRLPAQLHEAQNLFTRTGGAHAVALFGKDGTLVHISEDVGRHNAMDKLTGALFLKKLLPLSDHLVLFSGRLGYELVQKASAAGIPVICSIGAPTSLAIELAQDSDITVIGFLKEKSFNVYCGSLSIAEP